MERIALYISIDVLDSFIIFSTPWIEKDIQILLILPLIS